jgi:hypothetical protein
MVKLETLWKLELYRKEGEGEKITAICLICEGNNAVKRFTVNKGATASLLQHSKGKHKDHAAVVKLLAIEKEEADASAKQVALTNFVNIIPSSAVLYLKADHEFPR